jgi:PEP-CTERM motif
MGNASSSANATGGEGGEAISNNPFVEAGDGGSATVSASATASGGGTAMAQAAATGGVGGAGTISGAVGAANATSNATTARGTLAEAQSTAIGSSGQAHSTAKTSLAGVSVQSSAVAPTGGGTATTNAIAQGGSGQAFVNPGQTAYAFSTALPAKAYAATLIGGASDDASALLGPRDAVFGTAILGANYAPDGGGKSNTYSASSTFDFGYGGDLQLGLIDDQVSGFAKGLGFQSMEFTIMADGVEVLDVTFGSLAIAESFFHDDVIDLGADFGPNIDLTFGYTLVADGPGGFGFDFAISGAVPEPSTWAMMLVGFAGLGFAGYRSTRRGAVAGLRA